MAAHTHHSSVPPRGAWSTILGRSSFSLVMALLLFTALIWLRLRLVTDVPHRAYAEPKPQRQSHELGQGPQAVAPAQDR